MHSLKFYRNEAGELEGFKDTLNKSWNQRFVKKKGVSISCYLFFSIYSYRWESTGLAVAALMV